MFKLPKIKRLKLKKYEMFSSFAFKFNLRRYMKGVDVEEDGKQSVLPKWKRGAFSLLFEVARCRLPVSKLELKPRLVSAPETKM
jgi:hypothetical protein